MGGILYLLDEVDAVLVVLEVHFREVDLFLRVLLLRPG
jgi:hypothetical protein